MTEHEAIREIRKVLGRWELDNTERQTVLNEKAINEIYSIMTKIDTHKTNP